MTQGEENHFFFLQFILKGFGEWPALTVVFSWRRVKRRPPTEDLWRPDAHFDVGGPGCYVMSRVEWAEEWKYYISYNMTSLELPRYMVTSFELLYNIITLLELPLGIMTLLELLILHDIVRTTTLHYDTVGTSNITTSHRWNFYITHDIAGTSI